MPNYGGRRCVEPIPNAPALDVRDVSARYPRLNRLALDAVSARVMPGACVALVGANGAGKSTLLKTIAGLLPIERGQITVYGNQVAACHHRVAYLAQRNEVDWSFPISVRRLVLTGRYVHLGWLKWPRRDDWDLADEALAQLKLSDLAERQIGELSGGQQQRAMLARALAQDADLLLLDEPLNAVDAETRDIVSAVLNAQLAIGKTAVIATHDPGHDGDLYDGVLQLVDGRVDTQHSSIGGVLPLGEIGTAAHAHVHTTGLRA
jgi:ABC-type Mn2+/Zn2+ transport system ATPase subunit